MNTPWPKVRLGEVLSSVSRPELVDPSKPYSILGAHWYAGGLYTKDTKLGSGVQARELYRVEEGDFVYNRLFAWKGSFAIATADNAGCYVSSEFPCFVVRKDRADGRYLWCYFSRSTVWGEALGLSTGGTPTSRNRLKEDKLLGMEIPLPSLVEQRRIVARLEELAAKIEEARTLRQQSVAVLDRLQVSMAHRDDLDAGSKHAQGWIGASLGEVLTQVHNYHPVTSDAQYPNVGIYSFGRGLFAKPPINGISTSAKVLNRIHSGQFIYSRLFAFEGAYGEVPKRFDGSFVSNEYPTFDCDPSRVTSGFLFAYFKAPSVWSQVAAGSKGLGHRRQRVQPEQLLAHRLMLPPLEWQNRINRVRTEAGTIQHLQAETAAALDALLPSLLDKAFKGEL